MHEWSRFVERNGILYQQIFWPDGAEPVFQLLLSAVLIEEVLAHIHQEHGHQGIQRTLVLLRSRCYWPGMSNKVEQWCQACEWCQFAKNNKPNAQNPMGHLLASRPHDILAIDYTLKEPRCPHS